MDVTGTVHQIYPIFEGGKLKSKINVVIAVCVLVLLGLGIGLDTIYQNLGLSIVLVVVGIGIGLVGMLETLSTRTIGILIVCLIVGGLLYIVPSLQGPKIETGNRQDLVNQLSKGGK